MMALDPGDAGCTHGMSWRIHSSLLADPSTGVLDLPQLKAICYRIAMAVVAEIQANAVVPVGGFTIHANTLSGTSKVT